jgi:ATP-dependent RNA helicase RhlE
MSPASPVADRIDQSVYFVPRADKPQLLAKLVNDLPIARAIVFTRTKHGADRLVRRLDANGIRSESIHGNKSQNARQRALDNFRKGKICLLVATDVASRGIDVDGITHVVNYDLTDEPETYVHRIGRTARAGASGAALSFCDPEEVPNLRAIEKLIQRRIHIKQAGAIAEGPKPEFRPPAKKDRPKFKPHNPRFRPQQNPATSFAGHPGRSHRNGAHRRRLLTPA